MGIFLICLRMVETLLLQASRIGKGRFGQAFVFTGNDHLIASGNYKGIVGTAARTLSMWIKSTDKN